ncbi:hypothetical protein Mapa_010652 [Marchantia paleacea]|nr:hypothetical protein Mapa_010652 [Marchantia paleacea]
MPDGVMQNATGSIVVRIGATDDTNDGEVLAVGAGDGIDDAQAADREGHDHGPHALASGVPVSRVAGIELVAAADEVELRLEQQLVQQEEVEIAGHVEHVLDSDFYQATRDVPSQRGFGRRVVHGYGVIGRARPVSLGAGTRRLHPYVDLLPARCSHGTNGNFSFTRTDDKIRKT